MDEGHDVSSEMSDPIRSQADQADERVDLQPDAQASDVRPGSPSIRNGDWFGVARGESGVRRTNRRVYGQASMDGFLGRGLPTTAVNIFVTSVLLGDAPAKSLGKKSDKTSHNSIFNERNTLDRHGLHSF